MEQSSQLSSFGLHLIGGKLLPDHFIGQSQLHREVISNSIIVILFYHHRYFGVTMEIEYLPTCLIFLGIVMMQYTNTLTQPSYQNGKSKK
jgi:hypothetical protein